MLTTIRLILTGPVPSFLVLGVFVGHGLAGGTHSSSSALFTAITTFPVIRDVACLQCLLKETLTVSHEVFAARAAISSLRRVLRLVCKRLSQEYKKSNLSGNRGLEMKPETFDRGGGWVRAPQELRAQLLQKADIMRFSGRERQSDRIIK